jgi:hypothetical protein
MDDLIEALTIFRKYKNAKWPTNCSHDVLAIMEVTEEEVSEEDKKRLDELGFLFGGDDDDCWISFRFGSA